MDKHRSFLKDFYQSGSCMALDEKRFLVGWGSCFSCAAPPEKGPYFFFQTFFLNDPKPFVQFEHTAIFTLEELMDRCFKNREERYPLCYSPIWRLFSPSQFFQQFDSLQEKIRKKELQKGVVYTFAETEEFMTQERLQSAWLHALDYRAAHPGYLYAFWTKHCGLLGVTPELLLQMDLEKKTVSTKACAGTALSTEPSLLEDPKQYREHQWVIDGIQEALQEEGDLAIGQTHVQSFGLLSHLVTPIELSLKGPADPYAILAKLHPTPALGTYPKSEGKEWLLSCDTESKRNYFGAPVGCYDPKSAQLVLYVAIRNVQWSPKGMRIGAGCGIIQESRREVEWQEWRHKISSIQNMLHL